MRIPRGDPVVTIHRVIRVAHLPVSYESAGPDRRGFVRAVLKYIFSCDRI